ncbi:GyrI-like domain-containing protein [Domibacillus indicus]|uniref:GyrI-like domain-containing protein n=1 Tax=Domibacillus indicus TaxID=1437523 RepID=UPI000617CBDC|nr:effector binding domain-containing protein [Domibacillus indicus]
MKTAVTEKHIYGKKIRTNNQNPGAISRLWEEFLQLKAKGTVYGVYSNYASDFTGDYDLHIGIEETIPGESRLVIPAGSYHVVEVDHRDPNGVFHAWTDIWNSDIKRAYQTDFECYGEDGTIRIFLSVE